MSKQRKKLDSLNKEEVSNLVRRDGQQKTANHYGIKRGTFRDWLYENNLPTKKELVNKVSLKNETAEVTSDVNADISDPVQIVKDRGLDPEEWEFNSIKISEWGNPDNLNQSAKITLNKKSEHALVVAARTEGYNYPQPKASKPTSSGKLVVLSGDDQAPFYDKKLHDIYCSFLEDIKPDEIIKGGDGTDLPTVSKYKQNQDFVQAASVQKCIDSYYTILRDEREAAPNATIKKMWGNHDIRLRDFVVKFVPELYGIKRADIGDEELPVLNLANLLRLDELKIEHLDPGAGGYEHQQINLSKHLAVRHGWLVRSGSGATALKSLEALGHSIIVFHTHRQSQVFKTVFDIDGNPEVLTGVEAGCLCEVKSDGLDHTVNPDWQQGLCTAQVYEDGTFHIDLVQYVDGSLYWRGNRY